MNVNCICRRVAPVHLTRFETVYPPPPSSCLFPLTSHSRNNGDSLVNARHLLPSLSYWMTDYTHTPAVSPHKQASSNGGCGWAWERPTHFFALWRRMKNIHWETSLFWCCVQQPTGLAGRADPSGDKISNISHLNAGSGVPLVCFPLIHVLPSQVIFGHLKLQTTNKNWGRLTERQGKKSVTFWWSMV